MALPIVVIAAKVLSLKFLKGAVVGVARYASKLHQKEHTDDEGNVLNGRAKIDHIVRNELGAKDNLIFLILMLGNVFFGAQELLIWIWIFIAKRLYSEFRTGMPAAMEDPNDFAHRLQHAAWPKIWRAIGRWLAIASLVYWPVHPRDALKLVLNKDTRWVELYYQRHVYLIRIDQTRELCIADLTIHIDAERQISIFSRDNGEILLETYV